MSKFFNRPNLTTDAVTVVESPWDIVVPQEILDLPKKEYKERWFNPATEHHLLSLVEGQNPGFSVSQGNQAAMLHGFFADYDGVFTDDLVEAAKEKPPSRYKPAWWCISQSKKLHLVWLFDRPIAVAGNAHANALIKVIAAKLKAVRWGVGYDPECEDATQVMDIGREWHVFKENAFVPVEEIIMWDSDLFRKNVKKLVDEVVDMPSDVMVAEIRRRQWPHPVPEDLAIGKRCIRFWDPAADNCSAAQMTTGGFRVYTPHDGGFKSVKSLLGAEFCEQYTAKSMAPFYEDTYYCHSKDEYWRFFRADGAPHFERRTEKVLRRDLMTEARVSNRPAKGEDLSELDAALYEITRRNVVDAVAPVLYRPAGRIRVAELGTILNTSLVTVRKPAPRLPQVSEDELGRPPFANCPREYAESPSTCRWDNPYAVAGFPHIHHFLTGLFMTGQDRFDSWAAAGFPLHNQTGPMAHLHDPQLVHLISWMSHFYMFAARMAENPEPGTIMILAGPQGIGKSFFAAQLLGGLMGGWTEAHKMYIEGTRFNDQMVKYPVHVIDDKLVSSTHRDRLKFTEALKVVAANGRIRCEAKFGSSVENLPWPGRVVILSNVDSQSLSVLPDLDMSTRDKFSMLRLGPVKYPFGTREATQTWLAEELPAFAKFLLGWETPPEIRDPRFGVRAVQHADMAQASAENGLTQILVEVLETCIETACGTRDGSESGSEWAIVGNAVKICKWILSVDQTFVREVIDSRTLNNNLMTLYRSGGYNIDIDPKTRHWRIGYVLRKNNAENHLTPSTEV